MGFKASELLIYSLLQWSEIFSERGTRARSSQSYEGLICKCQCLGAHSTLSHQLYLLPSPRATPKLPLNNSWKAAEAEASVVMSPQIPFSEFYFVVLIISHLVFPRASARLKTPVNPVGFMVLLPILTAQSTWPHTIPSCLRWLPTIPWHNPETAETIPVLRPLLTLTLSLELMASFSKIWIFLEGWLLNSSLPFKLPWLLWILGDLWSLCNASGLGCHSCFLSAIQIL